MWVVVGVIGLVLVIGRSVPALWHMQGERGPAPVLRWCLGVGAGIGFVLGLLLTVLNAPDASVPERSTAGFLIAVVVMTFIGTVNGAFVGGVTVLARPKD